METDIMKTNTDTRPRSYYSGRIIADMTPQERDEEIRMLSRLFELTTAFAVVAAVVVAAVVTELIARLTP